MWNLQASEHCTQVWTRLVKVHIYSLDVLVRERKKTWWRSQNEKYWSEIAVVYTQQALLESHRHSFVLSHVVFYQQLFIPNGSQTSTWTWAIGSSFQFTEYPLTVKKTALQLHAASYPSAAVSDAPAVSIVNVNRKTTVCSSCLSTTDTERVKSLKGKRLMCT